MYMWFRSKYKLSHSVTVSCTDVVDRLIVKFKVATLSHPAAFVDVKVAELLDEV